MRACVRAMGGGGLTSNALFNSAGGSSASSQLPVLSSGRLNSTLLLLSPSQRLDAGSGSDNARSDFEFGFTVSPSQQASEGGGSGYVAPG